jgi:hypothetical protein
LLLAGCGTRPAALPALFPAADDLGWQAAGEAQVYDRETLYDLVDGQADAYLAYNLSQVAVQSYERASGSQVRVTIWELASPADAYGLFTSAIAGTPLDVGNEGDADPGQRIGFWQDRYYVELLSQPASPEADLLALAQAVSGRLPAGGERPALVDQLPREGLVARSPIFFRQEISIQDRLWLGGENLLNLDTQTEGVLARYELDGAGAWLLLVRYADAEAASAALAALESAQVADLIHAGTQGNLVGAVFGEAGSAQAGSLLAQALNGQ